MGRHKKYKVKLNEDERTALETFVSEGKKSAREINRARILLLADKEKKDREITDILGITRQTVHSVRKRFSECGYESVTDRLRERPRCGRPVTIDNRTEAGITVIACSDPPEGHAEWTLRLIADRKSTRLITDSISHESVRKILKKTN